MINFITGLIGWCFSFIFQSWLWPFAIFCSLWTWGSIGQTIDLLIIIGILFLFFKDLKIDKDNEFEDRLFLLFAFPIVLGSLISAFYTDSSLYTSIASAYSGFWGWTFHTLGFIGLFYAVLFLGSGSSSSRSSSDKRKSSSPSAPSIRQELSYPSESNVRRISSSHSETSIKRKNPSIQELNSHSFPSLDENQLNEIEKNVNKIRMTVRLKPSDYDDFDLLNELFPTIESKLARYKYLVYRTADISKLEEYRVLSLKFLNFVIRESSSKDKEIFKQYVQYRLLPNAQIAKGWNKESEKFSDKAIYWPHRQKCFEQALVILSKSKR